MQRSSLWMSYELRDANVYSLSVWLGVFACEWWQQSPRFAQQDKLSCSVLCHPLLFRLSLKWQDRYHKGQPLPLGNICMSARLSASSPISICPSFIVLFFLFSCSLFYSTQYTLSVTHSLTPWWMKSSGSASKVSKESRNKLNLFCHCVYWCSQLPQHTDVQCMTVTQ